MTLICFRPDRDLVNDMWDMGLSPYVGERPMSGGILLGRREQRQTWPFAEIPLSARWISDISSVK